MLTIPSRGRRVHCAWIRVADHSPQFVFQHSYIKQRSASASGVTLPSELLKWKHNRAELSSSAGSTPRSASSTRQESIAGRAATTPLTEANDDPPQSSEALPGIVTTHQSLQERLRNQAYEGVKDADPRLVEAYERILGLELHQRSAGTAIDGNDEILQTPELRAV